MCIFGEDVTMETGKISVIVPIYNAETSLKRCVNSIINQSYTNIEIILVDDGSTDDSANICDEYAHKDPRIRVLHQINSGLAGARNAGLDSATGEWILWVDSDDYIDVELCETVYLSAIKYNADIVVFGFSKFYDNGEIESFSFEEKSRLLSVSEAMKQLSDKRIGNFSWNRFFKKTLFDSIRYEEGKVYEDIGTTYRLIDKASTIFFLAKPLYYYYQSNASITHTISLKNIADKFEQRNQQYSFLKKYYDDAAKLVKEELLADALQYCIYAPYDPESYTYKKASSVIKNSRGVRLIFGGTYKIMYWLYRISVPIFNLICVLSKKRQFHEKKNG